MDLMRSLEYLIEFHVNQILFIHPLQPVEPQYPSLSKYAHSIDRKTNIWQWFDVQIYICV